MIKNNGRALLTVVTLFSLLSLSVPHSAQAAGPAAVNLGSAGNFAVLAKSAISATGSTLITGDIGVSPAAASFITGFGLTSSTDTTYATSPLVVGKIYAANYTNPTPTTLTTAVSDMQNAYTDAAGRSNPTATELGAGNIGGLTIAPGLYKWGTGVMIPTDVTLSGSASDVWIFQVAQTLTVSSGVKVKLTGGAQASNVFWVVGGQVTIGTTAEMNGNILGQTAIVLNTGAKLNGRALAQTAVTLDANAVTRPSSGSVISNPVTTQTQTNSSSNSSTNTSSNTTNNGVTSNTSSTNVTNITANSKAEGCIIGHTFSMTTGQVCATSNVPVALPISTAFGHEVRMIAINMQQGSSNNSVHILQNFLITQGKGPAAQRLSNNGATNYFGPLTRAALAEYQGQVGISPALGNFGPITRAHFSATY